MNEVYPSGSGQINNLGSVATASGDQYSDFGNDPATSMIGAAGVPLPGMGAGNKATRFATGSKVTIPHQSDYNPATAFTVEAWINFDSAAPNDGVIISKYQASTNQRGLAFQVDNATGRLELVVSTNGTAGGTTTYTSQWAVDFAAWTHVAAVYQTGSAPRLYINGVLDSKSQPVAPLNNVHASSADLRIGSWVNGNWFNGLLDEVAFYKTALRSRDILAHYQAAAVPEPATAVLLPAVTGLVLRRRRRG